MIEFPATETWTLNKQNTQCETLNTLDMAVAQGNWARAHLLDAESDFKMRKSTH